MGIYCNSVVFNSPTDRANQMKIRAWNLFGTFLSALLIVVVLAPALRAQPQGGEPSKTSADRERIISGIIGAMLDREHYDPQDLDPSLSAKAFQLFLERLDPNKQFFLVSDVSKLRTEAPHMVDGFVRGDYTLLNEVSSMFDRRLDFVENIYEDILAEPFDFSGHDVVMTNPDSIDYAANESGLRDRWTKNLKYQTLLRYLSLVETEEKDAEKFHPDLEEKAREQVAKNMKRMIERFHKLKREDHLSRYVNSVVNVFDPHTEYYPPLEKENFDIGITGQLEGIGAQLREEDGYIKVVNIVPGSASWRGKELEAEDLIIKVAQKGEEPVDVVGVDVDDAVKLIRGPKGTTVILTVKKPDGRIKPISIVRDVVVLEETYAKGAVIQNNEAGRRFGYIDLPKFYTDFNRTGAPRASDDIRKILEQFKEQGVEGVVLDLRNNGGGSLQEAVDIAGLFIKTGPVVQVQDRYGNRQVLSDLDADIAWDGDLVIMVNSFSASASEILSAMLQDYDRAVIVGAPTTFGKGTVQRFYDLDNAVPEAYSEYTPLGSVKITTQKFYRVNGVSTQFNGVVPDVILPDMFSYRSIGERSLEYALPGDTIEAARYRQWLNRDIPSKQLAVASQIRVEDSPFFGLIEEQARKMGEEQKRTSRSLNLQEMRAEQERLDEESEAIKKAMPELSHLTIQGLLSDETNEARAEMIKSFHEGLTKDVYVDEALSILNDMYTLSIQNGWTLHEPTKGK